MAKEAKQKSTRLSLDKIVADHGVQSRVKTDKTVIEDYAECIGAGDKLPPVVVFFDDKQYWLSEGFHRLEAHKKAGRKQIDCIIHKGTKEDAQWRTLQSNKTHGLRRSNEDKARAVKMAISHPKGAQMTDRLIAELLGVSATMVGKHRKEVAPTIKNGQSTKRTGRDGRTIETAKIGKGRKDNVKGGKTGAKAGGKMPKPRADRNGEEPVAATVDGKSDGRVVKEDPVESYRSMLKNLPGTLAKLAKQSEKIVGKAMKPKAAVAAIERMLSNMVELCEAEEKLAKAKA